MSVEVLSNIERKLKFNVSKNSVQSKVDEKIAKHAKKVKIQGFRPGKAPKKIVEQMYGGQAYEEALNDEINRVFIEALTEHKLNMIGYPKIDLDSNEGEEYAFSATFEVIPEFIIGDLSQEEIALPSCELTDSNVEEVINNLCKFRVTYKATLDAAKNKDQVKIDFVGTIDGEAFEGGTANDFSFILGQGKMLADFEAGIIGLTTNESREVEVKFPEDYNTQNLRGKTAIFKITLKEVSIPVLPELNEAFIKSLGAKEGTLEGLQAEIKENLTHEIARRLELRKRDAALDAISKVTPVDIPKALIHDEIHHMMDNAEKTLTRQGYPKDAIKLTHEMFEQDATKVAKLRLIIRNFIQENQLTVNDDEVREHVKDLATMYDDAKEYINWYFTDNKRVDEARGFALEKKAVQLIYSKAKEKPVTVSYQELMQHA